MPPVHGVHGANCLSRIGIAVHNFVANRLDHLVALIAGFRREYIQLPQAITCHI